MGGDIKYIIIWALAPNKGYLKLNRRKFTLHLNPVIITLIFVLSVSNIFAHKGIKCGFGDVISGKTTFVKFSPQKSQNSFITPEGHFTIYYDTTGTDAVNLTDNDNNGIPDIVEITGFHAEKAWKLMIDTIGFHPPYLYDGTYVTNYNVTIKRLYALYGQTLFDTNMDIPSVPGVNYESYIELNNNYDFASHLSDDPFIRDSMGIAVTISHEFFHAVQLGYNINLQNSGIENDLWWIEASAVYFEEACTPQINDYFEYLDSYYKTSNRPVYYSGGRIYGEVVFPLVITQKFSQEAILKIWENILNENAVNAIDSYLDDQNSSWEEILTIAGNWINAAGVSSINPMHLDLPDWPQNNHYQKIVYMSGENIIPEVENEYSILMVKFSNIPKSGLWFHPTAEDNPVLSITIKESDNVKIVKDNAAFLKNTIKASDLYIGRAWEPYNSLKQGLFKLIPQEALVYPNPLIFNKHNYLTIYSDGDVDFVKIFSVSGECVFYYKPAMGVKSVVIPIKQIEKKLSAGVFIYLIKSKEVQKGKLFVIP
ncbi:MAG: hypothetical protein KAR38_13715 [Calditrichia bacterium]|nr:hypothetical protein [Calditrichia bacterium]